MPSNCQTRIPITELHTSLLQVLGITPGVSRALHTTPGALPSFALSNRMLADLPFQIGAWPRGAAVAFSALHQTSRFGSRALSDPSLGPLQQPKLRTQRPGSVASTLRLSRTSGPLPKGLAAVSGGHPQGGVRCATVEADGST